MLYKESIKVWNTGKVTNLLGRFFLKFTYSSNRMDNSETSFRDVETIFKGEKVTDFRGNRKSQTTLSKTFTIRSGK